MVHFNNINIDKNGTLLITISLESNISQKEKTECQRQIAIIDNHEHLVQLEIFRF